MLKQILGAAVAASTLGLAACVQDTSDQLQLAGETALTEAEMQRAMGREYVCYSVDGLQIAGAYDMFLDKDVTVPGGGKEDFLAGFYVQPGGRGDSDYGEGYHAIVTMLGGNAMRAEGIRIIPSDAPGEIDENTRMELIEHNQTFLFYKSESFPKTMLVSTTFLDRGQTVLGCESVGGRPKWMRLFDSVIEEANKSYNAERRSFT